MYLVQVFAKKDFLLEKEDNCKTLSSLMEAINYLIAYHDETNHYLQIQLMKYQTLFDYLDNNIAEIGSQKPQQVVQDNVQRAADEEEDVQQLDAEENNQADDERDDGNEGDQLESGEAEQVAVPASGSPTDANNAQGAAQPSGSLESQVQVQIKPKTVEESKAEGDQQP